MTNNKQRWAAAFSFLLCAALLWPIRENFREKPRDNFPLSYFPMFSQKRGATYEVYYILGYDAQGEKRYLSHKLAGKGGLNQVRRQLRKYDKKGEGPELARRVAKKIAKSSDESLKDIVSVSFAKGKFNFDQYFLYKNKTPKREIIIASHNVDRP